MILLLRMTSNRCISLTVVGFCCASIDGVPSLVSSKWTVVFVLEPAVALSVKHFSADQPFPWIDRSNLCSRDFLLVPRNHFSMNIPSSVSKIPAYYYVGCEHPTPFPPHSLRFHPIPNRSQAVHQFSIGADVVWDSFSSSYCWPFWHPSLPLDTIRNEQSVTDSRQKN